MSSVSKVIKYLINHPTHISSETEILKDILDYIYRNENKDITTGQLLEDFSNHEFFKYILSNSVED